VRESTGRATADERRLAALPTDGGPFIGRAVCLGPADDVLSIDAEVTTAENRWSAAGEPTLYLASDAAVALAELARHLDDTPEAGGVWSVDVECAQVLDLREACASSESHPGAWLEGETCRGLAGIVRDRPGSTGILVPSVAFLDDLSRFNLVLFADRVTAAGPLERWIRPVERVLSVRREAGEGR